MASRTLLDKLVNLRESPSPRLLLLTDTVEVRGRGLLYSVVYAHLRAGTRVLYLTTKFPPQDVQKHIIDSSTIGKVEFYDGATDPCGWDSGTPAECVTQPLSEIVKRGRRECRTGGKVTVVVDTLEGLALHQDACQLVKGLHTLVNDSEVEQVVVYCGRDIVPEGLLQAITHLAACVLNLQPSTPCSCHTVLKRPSGKVVKAQEEFSITPDFKVTGVRPVQKSKEQVSSQSCSSDATPDSLLAATTFSLSLTEDQRRAKNKLLLPHTRVQGGGGQIHYTPDREDDWDEDDPDDDLDI